MYVLSEIRSLMKKPELETRIVAGVEKTTEALRKGDFSEALFWKEMVQMYADEYNRRSYVLTGCDYGQVFMGGEDE